MKKTYKVKDENGNYIDLDPSTLKSEPIKHESLTNDLLKRISKVYEVIREVITFNEHPMSLEQFELSFMRDENPISSISLWEIISSSFIKASGFFPDDQYNKQQIYNWLMLLVMGAISKDDEEKDEVKIIKKCFYSSIEKDKN